MGHPAFFLPFGWAHKGRGWGKKTAGPSASLGMTNWRVALTSAVITEGWREPEDRRCRAVVSHISRKTSEMWGTRRSQRKDPADYIRFTASTSTMILRRG